MKARRGKEKTETTEGKRERRGPSKRWAEITKGKESEEEKEKKKGKSIRVKTVGRGELAETNRAGVGRKSSYPTSAHKQGRGDQVLTRETTGFHHSEQRLRRGCESPSSTLHALLIRRDKTAQANGKPSPRNRRDLHKIRHEPLPLDIDPPWGPTRLRSGHRKEGEGQSLNLFAEELPGANPLKHVASHPYRQGFRTPSVKVSSLHFKFNLKDSMVSPSNLLGKFKAGESH